MVRVKAVRRFVEPTDRANEGAARITLYSTRRRQVQATPQTGSGRAAQTAARMTHRGEVDERNAR